MSRRSKLFSDAGELLEALCRSAARDPSLSDRARRLLLPLERADVERGSRLRETLQAYYQCSGSVARTAERLFLHRNSVRYRLDHIRALLGCDIDDVATAAALMAAFGIVDLGGAAAAVNEGIRHETQRAQ